MAKVKSVDVENEVVDTPKGNVYLNPTLGTVSFDLNGNPFIVSGNGRVFISEENEQYIPQGFPLVLVPDPYTSA